MPKLRRKGKRFVLKKRAPTAASAMKVAKIALTRSRPEPKWYPWNTSSTVGTTPPTFDLLPGISNGSTVNTFTGDQIRLKSLSLRMFITHTQSAAVAVRVIILRYFDEDLQGPPNITDILTTGGGSYLTNGFKNPVTTRESKFLFDRTYAVQNYNSDDPTSDIQNVKIFLNLKNALVQFGDNSGIKIQKGGIYLVVLPTASVDIEGSSIIHFTDV